MNCIVLSALAGATLSFVTVANAQQLDFANVQIKTTDLGHNIWVLSSVGGTIGGGGPLPNVILVVGTDGAIVVDTSFAPLHDKIKAAISTVTDKPVRVVINTHYHGDHTGGDQAFWLEGARVIAQDNVLKREAEGVVNPQTGQRSAIIPAGGRPTETYHERLVVRVGGRTAILTHIHDAHTDGDTAVLFPDADVLATGDLVSALFPAIDLPVGGNINGMIRAVDILIARTDAKTKVVPGHFPATDRSGLRAYKARLIQARERIAKLIKDGKTEDEVVAIKPLADQQAQVGANDVFTANFVRRVYESLKPAKS